VISEQSTGFPGYNSIIGRDKATIGRMPVDNGYSTAWFGKAHNVPSLQASQVGPFDQWPTGMGFEHFYGFVGGDANQWEPNLFRNSTQIYPFKGQEGQWNLITAMADDAIDDMTRIHQIDPAKPIFIKYAPGSTHAPDHPTKEWVDKIHAMHLFEDGYEKLRERIFENQKEVGIVPKDATLTAPPGWRGKTLRPFHVPNHLASLFCGSPRSASLMPLSAATELALYSSTGARFLPVPPTPCALARIRFSATCVSQLSMPRSSRCSSVSFLRCLLRSRPPCARPAATAASMCCLASSKGLEVGLFKRSFPCRLHPEPGIRRA